ncbi:MAG: class I SAM-dependent methyltransferase [Pirellula sp.]|jgi:hypothetical protein|nr:hypothetical protein [Pirellula sp.]
MHFTVEAQNKIRSHIESVRTCGPIVALDGTAGNGFDTCFLAELVGKEGRVVAMDLQEDAILITRNKLEALGWLERVNCIRDCHSNAQRYLEPHCGHGLNVAMFNLGYLPLGNKEIITKQETTLAALNAVFGVLVENGILSVLSYPGHTGGSDEHVAVEAWIDQVKKHARIETYRDENNRLSPVLWLVFT